MEIGYVLCGVGTEVLYIIQIKTADSSNVQATLLKFVLPVGNKFNQ